MDVVSYDGDLQMFREVHHLDAATLCFWRWLAARRGEHRNREIVGSPLPSAPSAPSVPSGPSYSWTS
jgi:hypothetical protein